MTPSEQAAPPQNPLPGEKWRSRDPRDNGLIIEILDVANGYVRIQRYRKTTVGLPRFHRDYERVLDIGAERSPSVERTE